MNDTNNERSAGPSAPDALHDRLDSWKEIAAYLGRGVTTVQRWEQDEGLPIHRLPHAKRGSVFAFKRELDGWRMRRSQPRDGVVVGDTVATEHAVVATPPAKRVVTRGLLVAAVCLAGIVVVSLGATWGLRGGTLRLNHEAAAASMMPRPLANDDANENTPSLSPDGTEVVYLWTRPGATGLYVKPVAGGATRRILVGDVKMDGFPQWSPRGDLIAFLATEGESGRAVYIIPASGGTPRRVTSASGIGLCWTPDGNSLGFVDWSVNGEPLSIFSISLTTGERRRLTSPPASSFGDTHCAFSPDGRLAVVRHYTREQSDVCVVRLDGGGREIVERVSYDFDGIDGLVWTPDGRDIVFGSHSGLWRVPGSTDRLQPPVRVAPGTEIGHPTFSRPMEGRPARLAYSTGIVDVNLWRSDVLENGTPESARVQGSTDWESHPAFSPDGRRIAFASNRSGANEIWTANPDGSDARQVTFHRGPMVVSPQWSPDGERIAYSAQVGGNRDIYVTRLDGTKATRLTWEPSQEEFPSWSRDGRWIYFRSNRTGIGQVWKLPAGGGTAYRMITGQASQAFESPDGTLLYFVRSFDVPGVWSVPVEGGRETLVVPNVNESVWGVADNGIGFLVSSARLSPEGPTIRFLDLASREVRVIARLPSGRLHTGFAVSRDGRSFLWTRTDRSERDLMLIDRWE